MTLLDSSNGVRVEQTSKSDSWSLPFLEIDKKCWYAFKARPSNSISERACTYKLSVFLFFNASPTVIFELLGGSMIGNVRLVDSFDRQVYKI